MGKYNGADYQKNIEKQHSESVLTEEREYWWNEDYLELLSKRLNFDQCQKVADIGCGIGTMSFALSKFFPENTVIKGMDFEKGHIKKARQKSKKKSREHGNEFHFVEGDAMDIPFETDEMDLTFCQTLLIHVDQPTHVLEEMKRVTKNDGWIVAIEPNNLVHSLMFDNYAQTHFDIDDMMKIIEVRLRCEKGKRKLGLGFNSLGDALPDLFTQVGLEDIQVWISDKALSCIPPYDTREKRVRVAQLIDWLETGGGGGFNYDRDLWYFKAGGGKKADFDIYWNYVMMYKEKLLKQLIEQKYISAGGSLMYIVAGRVSK
ncbi:class I SAM-dependent methyltransferase [Fulvivirga sp. 29W222]|uniref:Class I SAM-dependent methyltransferase n=1 Tax=Fulvivirga marina TaxID=2494733 RepID=A0A937FTL3_9BACT|nr:class I SAM-dependent methyltransferase [Fulvivirga marina]MBL6445559.1 class I SAM-dependent methyltransferase [Fulvivirga marina]